MNTNWKKQIILFLSSQTISLIGSMLVQYAISWYIMLKTDSGFMLTISILCGFLPTFFLSPFAGVWADRFSRKKLIIISDAVIATTTLLLALAFMFGHDYIWLLFVASAIRAFGAGIQTPAVNSFIPQIVPQDQLTRINGINSIVQSSFMIISPMISGLLLSIASIEIIFFIDVVTAALAIIILLFFLHVPVHAKALENQKIDYFYDLKEGLDYIKGHSFVKVLITFNAFLLILYAPLAFLTTLQVSRRFLTINIQEYLLLSILEAVFAGGMIIGGIFVSVRGGIFKNRLHTIVFTEIVIAISTILFGVLGLASSFYRGWILVLIFVFYLLFMGIVGVMMPIMNTPFTVMLQEKVENEYLGRVFGVFGMVSSLMMPLGMIIFGPLADIFPIEYMLIFTGALMFFVIRGMGRSQVLLEAGKPVEQVSLVSEETIHI